jgi:hypothetical protein
LHALHYIAMVGDLRCLFFRCVLYFCLAAVVSVTKALSPFQPHPRSPLPAISFWRRLRALAIGNRLGAPENSNMGI